jgi:Ni,Fe-hydrogenase III large subunit/Ni,Fe-hydrogenase III component G
MTKYKDIIQRFLPDVEDLQYHSNLCVFEVPMNQIVSCCEELHHRRSLPLKIISAFDERAETGTFRVLYVFGIPGENVFLAPFIRVRDSFPSLTPLIHEASTYERKIKTFFGLTPVGHPHCRPIILHENWPEDVYPLRKDFPWDTRVNSAAGEYHYRKLEGEGIYEIPVGPVLAGIIEPGHFRFSVAGEEILNLEPRLGYSHRGCEKLFEVLPLEGKLKLSERISGDSSFSHSLAFCLALESLSDMAVSARDDYLRVIFAELERLANHLGDIGAIMLDTGYNFGGANSARLREMVLQQNENLTGSRFLRGVTRLGGVNTEVAVDEARGLLAWLDRLLSDFTEVITIAQNSSSLLNRLKNTGILVPQITLDHGIVGVASRAVGFPMDARIDNPYAAYGKIQFDLATEESGDVYARFKVRLKEVYSSIQIMKAALNNLPELAVMKTKGPFEFRKESFALGLVEGWRGEIVYLVKTDGVGAICRVEVRDPSYLNWPVLDYAGRGNVVPDFPLINKSFNLSYSGNDL